MQQQTIHLKDYQPPAYHIPRTELAFEIRDTSVRISSVLHVEVNGDTTGGQPLVLNGERLSLINVELDESPLSSDRYTLTDKTLTIANVPDQFTLKIVVEIDPYNNTWLEGLYASGNVLCTQNESEGFRKITYYLDRPDVMSIFITTITANAERFPYLLSNGNLETEKMLPNGLRRVRWHDPFPKPCYLFALVAGDFARVEDAFTTASGRHIKLQVYVDHGNEDQVQHTLASLKRAMRWDEETYGLEYDLDLFMIVAVDAFNFGAMENKGLNIFNSVYALANPDTATDRDFQNVESVVAHEYFHNWTGDRITLRDWFQITLKEGLTVYRDSEFTADTYSRPIKRIEDVQDLRERQFSEDAGPNAHPIQPKAYQEINNFYTNTVYSKGSEIIRMLSVLLGQDGFQKGMACYVERFDGKAITTEDFLHAMESANGVTLPQFRRWYHQAGTPTCHVTGHHNADAATFSLTVRQSCPLTADGSPKEPFYFPMTLGLLGSNGSDLPLTLQGETEVPSLTSQSLVISKPEHVFVFAGITHPPTPSLFRNFSAPIKVTYNYTRQDLMLLLQHDSDAFNRYDASQQLAQACLLEMTEALQQGETPSLDNAILDAYSGLIQDASTDPAFCAQVLTLPGIAVLNQELDVFDFENTFRARYTFKKALAKRYAAALTTHYKDFTMERYSLDSAAVAKRTFRNLCLDFLSYLDDGAIDLANAQFHGADNMTDRLAALRILCETTSPQRDIALDAFLERYKDNFNVTNKWFAVQASATRRPDVLADVDALSRHPRFDCQNPNHLRSLYGAYSSNLPAFHNASGCGYRLIADLTIKVDTFNSQVAAGLGKTFKHLGKLDTERRALMRTELEHIMATPNISVGLHEIIANTLKQ